MANFKLIIEYDGTAYHGWQIQADKPTIQETIEAALSFMTKEHVHVIGSGRTDAGVHALGQAANFHATAKISPRSFHAGLNSLLPNDIVIRSCEVVDDAFHARFNAIGKTYQYRIRNRLTPSAIGRQYEWFIRKKLDLAAMRTAVKMILGTHDFKSFEGTGSPREHTVRTIKHAAVSEGENGRLFIDITADGFLRYMVRNIIGTLVDVGFAKISPEDFQKILETKDRGSAGITAPPHGLFLVSVDYP
ncbi:MAG: tRNA pseudouridine(38-40) synthase TruA [Desulfobacterales bacterium]|nr:tRNA pseudouridine(38-40) synthase TruA [Desulfobacterales bacterium]